MEPYNVGLLTILGIGVFGGTLGASLFQRLHIPQVVGYIAIGLVIGQLGFGIIDHDMVQQLQMVNLFALGIIGFLVGGELHADVFRGKGKQLFAILVGEGVLAFVLVAVAVAAIFWFLTADWAVAVAAGMVFGAIASATDPASTLNVLWEYRSRGVLTTTLIAIVALDDALAMTLYGLGTATARILTGGDASLSEEVMKTSMELGGAIALGVLSGYVLQFILRWIGRPDKDFATAVGTILFIIGIAATLHMDVILSSMALGVTLINVIPRRSKELFDTVRSFANPIYVIFFVLVGARLDVSNMPGWLWGLVAVYVICRSVGKMAGAYAGAALTHADPAVKRYAGLGLFAQGGIAVGLSIMASQHLADVKVSPTLSLADAVVFGVTASTLVVQIMGPSLIKLASKLAGEIGRDVTEQDVIDSWTVTDAMTKDVKPIPMSTPLTGVFRIFSDNDHLVYPVVDRHDKLQGILSLDTLKNVLINQDTWDWVLAADVMEPMRDKVDPESKLDTALKYMREVGAEEMPVVDSDSRAVGMLDDRIARRRVSEEVVRRRQA